MNRYAILIIIVVLHTTGCGIKKNIAIGVDNEIAVIADSLDWVQFQSLLEEVFEKEIYTPQREKILSLSWSPPAQFADRFRQTNLLILGTLSKHGDTADLIKDLLGSEIIEKVRNGKIYLIAEEDQYARNQQFMILTAWDKTTLRDRLERNSGYIFDIFNESVNKRASERVLGKRSKKRLSDKIKNTHGFTFRIPLDYSIILDDQEQRVLWLVSDGIRRWFMVYWEEVDDIPVINADWIMDKRNALGLTVMDTVRVNRDYLLEDRIIIDDKVALKLSGLYEKIHEQLGGPFVSFAFYDDNSKRIYLLDGAVFAPGEEKLKYLRTLELMARSFKVSGVDS